MTAGTVLAAVLVGVVMGTAGRLVLPPGHRVSRMAILMCGLTGAAIGLLVGVAVFANRELIVLAQIGASIALVWGYAKLHTFDNLHSSS